MSDEVRVVRVEASDLAPYAKGLRALESGMRYPLADGADSFTIDHGEAYHPFFSGLGKPCFLVALAGEEVVATLALVAREAREGEETVRAVYLADYKIAPAHRGGVLAAKIAWSAVSAPVALSFLRGWRWAYFAAMRGERGDVTRSARGASPLRAFRPLARLELYFEAPERLAALRVENAPRPPSADGLDLSPRPPGALPESTSGKKDLVLASSGKPWALVHLPRGPRGWGASLGAYLKESGDSLVARGGEGIACFSLDARLRDHVEWLAGQGIAPGALATVHALAFPPWRESPAWVHLATSEI